MTNLIMHPWHLLLTILAGDVHEEQQQVIEYLRTEIDWRIAPESID